MLDSIYMVAALFVESGGVYFDVPHVEPYDLTRDAMTYHGPWPVVAHPPCNRWTNFAKLNYKRWGGEHNRPGNDGGKFEFALNAVRKYGGVLEHPAYSHAWAAYGLLRPERGRWIRDSEGNYVCEIWQSAYGHKARKTTWLFYHGEPPKDLRWIYKAGVCQIGGFDRIKPTISGKAASATPLEFRDELVSLALCSRNCRPDRQ